MGYTHYLYREEQLDKENFAKASQDCKKAAEWLKIPIQFEYDCPEPPVFTDELIRFNGVSENGHETFCISTVYKDEHGYSSKDTTGKFFEFCKTARKPYDTVVTACLIILKHYLGEQITVKSDGYPEEWEPGLEACQKCLGYGEIPFQKDRK